MDKLLFVEDDESLALGIEFTLRDEGYEVYRAATVKEAQSLFSTEALDLILLDVNLPDGNGYELCKDIRTKSDIPIIFLTACDDEVNIVLGLEIGGDDYITKPFRVRELLSRIKVALRRNKNTAAGNKLKSGNILVDTSKAVIKKNEQEITVTAQEYRLLLIFMNNPKVLMKRDQILKELTEEEECFFDENTLSVYIKRVREKIEDTPKNPSYIITQRGLGYSWNKEVAKE